MPFLLSESNADRAGLDEECALWDWARTAGVSVAELRQWLAGRARTGTTTLLAIAVFPSLLVAAGCASFDGAGLKPGQATSAEVEHVMGTPAETRKVGGETLLYYPRQPYGDATFVARIGQDGRLIDIEQRLTDANVAKIVPNVTTGAQVRDLLGPPAQTSHYVLNNSTVWTWYMAPLGDSRRREELDVQMSPDGVVRDVYKLHPRRGAL